MLRQGGVNVAVFRWLLPASAGLLLALAFPPFDAFQLAWLGLIPLCIAVRDVPWGEACRRGYIAGLVFFGSTLWWIGHVTVPGAVAVIAILALYVALAALWFRFVLGAAAGADSPLLNLRSAILCAAGWVVLEWVRGCFLLGGFGWNFLGASQYRTAALLPFASVTGVYGVSAVLCAVNVIFFLTGLRFYTHLRAGQPIRRLNWELYAVMLVVCAMFLHGARELAARKSRPHRPLQIALIQANIPQSLKFVPEQKQMVLDRHRELTTTAAITKPDLIIWPETAVPDPLRFDRDSYALATNLAITTGAHLLTGTIDYRPYSQPPEAYNAAILLSPTGDTLEIYRKIHLVPFGEYVPLQRFTAGLVSRIGPEGYDVTQGYGFQRGTEHTIFEASGFRFGAVICFEDTVPHLYRHFVARGVDFMVNLTNDAWFRESPAAAMHLANAVFRAVETRRPLIRSTNNGITCVVDECGVIRAELEPFTESALTFELAVPEGTGHTFYVRHGDVFVALCAVMSTGAVIWRTRRRASRGQP